MAITPYSTPYSIVLYVRPFTKYFAYGYLLVFNNKSNLFFMPSLQYRIKGHNNHNNNHYKSDRTPYGY
jgi:hypothetical protein